MKNTKHTELNDPAVKTDQNTSQSKRKLLTSLGATSTLIGATTLAPEAWVKPVVNSIILPAHAVHSPNIPPHPRISVSGLTTMTLEGGTATANLSLDDKPPTEVTVTASADNGVTALNTVTFTPANHNVPQQINFTVPKVTGNTTVTITFSANDGTDIVSVTKTFDVLDAPDVVPKISVSGLAAMTREGGTAIANVSLDAEPATDVTVTASADNDGVTASNTVTFTSANFDQIQSITLTVPQVTENTTVTITFSANDGTGIDSVIRTLQVTDVPVITVTPPTATVKELETVEVTVSLSDVPGESVTVTISSSSDSLSAPSPLVLTSDNSYTDTVTLTAAEVGAAGATATVTAEAEGYISGEATISVTDVSIPGIKVNPESSITLGETETLPVQVKLNSMPSGPVKVTITIAQAFGDAGGRITSVNGLGLGTTGATTAALDFTTDNYNRAQLVMLRGANDIRENINTSVTFTAASSDTDYDSMTEDLSVTLVDTIPPGITCTTPGGTVGGMIDESTTQTVNVSLNTKPTRAVIVTATSDNNSVLTFSGGGFIGTIPANSNAGGLLPFVLQTMSVDSHTDVTVTFTFTSDDPHYSGSSLTKVLNYEVRNTSNEPPKNVVATPTPTTAAASTDDKVGEVVVSWVSPEADTDAVVTGYNVQITGTGGVDETTERLSTVRSQRFIGLAKGAYSCTVTAVYSSGIPLQPAAAAVSAIVMVRST